MVFCKKQYRGLLKYSQQLEKEGNHLSDISESDYPELLGYSGKMYGQLEWESRDSYAELMGHFLNGKISEGRLKIEFLKIQESHEQIHNRLESNLIILSPNSKSDYVADLIDEFYWVLEDLSVDSTLSLEELGSLIKENKYEEAEKKKQREIYNSVKEIYLQLQSIVKDYRTNCNGSTDLSELVDQLNWENQDQYSELIEEFLDESSNFLNLKERYQSIVRVGKEFESNSISLKVNYQALGFSNFIKILIQLFDRYQIDSTISPKVFKSWVRKILFEMKNHYS